MHACMHACLPRRVVVSMHEDGVQYFGKTCCMMLDSVQYSGAMTMLRGPPAWTRAVKSSVSWSMDILPG